MRRTIINVDSSLFPGKGFRGFTHDACDAVDRASIGWMRGLSEDLKQFGSGVAFFAASMFTTSRQRAGGVMLGGGRSLWTLYRGIYRGIRAVLLAGAMSPVVPFAFGVGSALSFDTDKMPRDKAVNATAQYAALGAYGIANESCVQYFHTDCPKVAKAVSTFSALGARAWTEFDRDAVFGEPDSVTSKIVTVKTSAHGNRRTERTTNVTREATQQGFPFSRRSGIFLVPRQ